MYQSPDVDSYLSTELDNYVNEDYENVFLEDKIDQLDSRYHHMEPNLYIRHVITELTEEQLESGRVYDEDLEKKLRQLSKMLFKKGVIKDYNLVQNIEDKLVNSNEVSKDKVLKFESPRVKKIQIKRDPIQVQNQYSFENKINQKLKKSHFQKYEKEIKMSNIQDLQQQQPPQKVLKKSKTLEEPQNNDKKVEKRKVLYSRCPSSELKRFERSYTAVTPGRETKDRPFSPDPYSSNTSRPQSCLNKSRKKSIDNFGNMGTSSRQRNEGKLKKRVELESEKSERERGMKKHERTKSTSFVKSILNSNKSTARFYNEENKSEVVVNVTVRCISPSHPEKSKKEKRVDESQKNLLKILKRVKKFINKDPGDDTNLRKLENLLKGTT